MVTESTSSLIHSQGQQFSINNRFHGVSSSSDDDEDDTSTVKAISEKAASNRAKEGCSNDADCCSRQQSTAVVLDIEDLLAASAAKHSAKNLATPDNVNNTNSSGGSNGLCSTKFNCGGTSRQNCQNLISEYQDHAHHGLEPLEFPENLDEHQTMRHTVLLILLLCSMFVVSCPLIILYI